MTKRPVLLISQPIGHKAGKPVMGIPSRLVDPETRDPVPGIGKITLNIPANGVLTCTAEILLGGVEIVQDPAKDYFVQTEVTSGGRVIACKPLEGEDYIQVADALQSQSSQPDAIEQAEPGNGATAP